MADKLQESGLSEKFRILRQNPEALYKIFLPCFQISQVREGQKMALFPTEKAPFLQHTVTQLLTIRPISIPFRESREVAAAEPLRLCNGAAIGLQRGARCNPIAAPLQPNEGLIARKAPFFCPKTSIKKSQSFAFQKSNKGLTASERHFSGHIFPHLSHFGKTRKGLKGSENNKLREIFRTRFCNNKSRWVL